MIQSRLTTLLSVFVLCASLIAVSGCGSPSESASSSSMLRITGSDTMVHLSTDWAEGFVQANPKVEVAVNGGGSGNGISAILNGATDIAPSSRPLKPKELEKGREKGLKTTPIALDAIAIVVNPKNPITTLSTTQLKDLYTGKIRSWKALGGPDKTVLLFSRETSSGTYEFFQEHVLQKQDFAPQARLIPSTIAILETVAEDDWSIGYVGLGYALKAQDKVRILAIQNTPQRPAIMPSAATVLNGQYPISRELYLITSKTLSPTGQEFMRFCQSPTGQALVDKAGFIPIKSQPIHLKRPTGHRAHG